MSKIPNLVFYFIHYKDINYQKRKYNIILFNSLSELDKLELKLKLQTLTLINLTLLGQFEIIIIHYLKEKDS